MENSPTNPLRPACHGAERGEEKTMVRTGMARIRPPYSEIRGMAPLIDHADDQEEHAGGDAWLICWSMEPAIPAVSAKIPSVQSPGG